MHPWKKFHQRNFPYYYLATLVIITVAEWLYYSSLLSLLLIVSILDFELRKFANKGEVGLDRGDLDVQEQEQLK